MARPDPLRAFRFRLEFDSTLHGGFQTVSGLERQCEIEAFREGGMNNAEHQLVTRTTYPPLVLKRGLVDAELWSWHQDVIRGVVERQTIAIVLMDEAGEEQWRWTCVRAFPSKWTGAELDAVGGGLATETVEFVHEGMERE